MNEVKHLSEKTLLDNFEKTGIWQLDDSENEAYGKIIHDKHDGVKLTIMCSSTNLPRIYREFKHVCGVLETGEQVMLEKCMPITIRSLSRVLNVEYRVTRMFVGNVLPNSDLKFNKISIPYTSLYTWLAHQSMNTEGMFNQSGDKGIIERTQPQDLEIEITNKLALQINYGYSVPHTAVIKDFTIYQSAAMALISKEPLAVNELYKKITYLRNFLMLGTGTNVQPKSIKVAADGTEFVSVFPGYRVYDNVVDEQEFVDLDFNYLQIKENFKEIIRSWFEFSEKYHIPLDLYFRTQLERHLMDLVTIFLRIAQALDASHRIEVSSKGCFKDRLNYIFGHSHNILDGIQQEKFVDKVVKIRDYHSHGFIDDFKGDMPDMAEFIEITRKLRLLMYGYIIEKLEIPDAIKDIIVQKAINRLL